MRTFPAMFRSMSVTNKLQLFTCMLLLSTAFFFERAPAHGSHDEQLQHYSQQLLRQPGDHGILLDRAAVYLRQGNTALAFKDIQTAAKISDQTEAAYLLGLYHVAENDHQAALAAFSEYLARYPHHIAAIHHRAKCHTALGSTAGAISDYENLLDTSMQHSPDYYLELARVQSSVESGGIEQALKTLDRGMNKLGILVSLQTAGIQYEINRGNYRMAMERHESLKPWLGKTPQWRLRQKQLSRYLMVEINKAAIETSDRS